MKEPKTNGAPRQWPVENISRWPIDALLPYARNPKTHPPEQVKLIAQSLARFGQAQIVLVDGDEGPAQGEIIAGHGRVLAAEQLGWSTVIVGEAKGWSDEEKRAYRIMDNELGSERLAPYDPTLLQFEVRELKGVDFDLSLLGFAPFQIDQMISGAPGKDPDAPALEPPAAPFVQAGDLWLLDKHRLLVGDATVAKDVKRALGGNTPVLMVTDPPYGVDYDPLWRRRAAVSFNPKKLGRIVNDDRADWYDALHLFPGTVIYCWHAGLHSSETQGMIERAGFQIVSQIIWSKDRFALSGGDYHWRHEPCWYAVRKGAKHNWQVGRDQNTVWPIRAREDSGHGHGTQKPLECMRRPINNNSSPNDYVYDPFVGSGTTILAADLLARRCIAMDIDPAYAQVAVERWQEFSGKPAVLDGDGRTFDAIRKQRLAKSDSRKSVQRKDRSRTGKKRALPSARNAGQPSAR